MIIDCHAHLDQRMLPLDALVGKMDQYGIERVALIPRVTENEVTDKSKTLLTAQRVMMNSTFLRPLAASASKSFYDAEGNLRPMWRPFTASGGDYVKWVETDNESISEVLKAHPHRFFGWIFLNPKNNSEILDELERWRSVEGMIGIKVHPYWHQYPIRALEPIARRAEELSLPMLVHMGFGEQGDFGWLADAFPRLKIIYSHCGRPYYKKVWSQVRDRPNSFMDISSDHLSERFVRKAIKLVGAAKCLYGTDSPYGFTAGDGSYDYGEILSWVERLPLSDRDRRSILGDNFLGLIDI